MNLDKFDAILSITSPAKVNEEFDDRVYHQGSIDYSLKGSPDEMPDYKLQGAYTFGKSLSSLLDGMSKGFYNKVTDYGKYLIVTIGFHNILTGRSAEKTYLIVFEYRGNGKIYSTSNKYRTINGIQQAMSYIKSAANVLQNQTSNKL